ncbi:DUF6283 family protein [Nocardia sp. NPDC004123]
MFQCHQTDTDSNRRRLRAGWVGCHCDELLGLRLAVLGAVSAMPRSRTL